jgi:hypothetical protein
MVILKMQNVVVFSGTMKLIFKVVMLPILLFTLLLLDIALKMMLLHQAGEPW